MKHSFDRQRSIDTASADTGARVAIPEAVEAVLHVTNENRTWASRQMDNGIMMGREGKVEVGDLEVWRNR